MHEGGIGMKTWFVSKQGIAAVLALTLAFAAAGCTGSVAEPDTEPATAETTPPASGDAAPPKEAPPEPMEIDWGIWFQSEGIVNDTEVEKALEEKFNIRINPVKITDASIASGDIPDIFTLGDPVNIAAYQAQGVLMEVDPAALEQKLPEYYKDLLSVDQKLLEPATFDDKLWAIPMFVTMRPYDFAMLWRADWLENVGIDKVPQTLEEFEKAVYAFAKEDPDGNGKHDTYGLTGTMTTTWSSGFYSIYGAFGTEPTMWLERNGEVVNGSILPETKEALALLRKWYADKVIDPDFITDTQENYRTKLYNGRIGVIEETFSNMATDTSSTVVGMKSVNPDAKLAVGANPEGPGGNGSWNWGSKSNYIVFGKHVADEPEKLEKLYEILRDYSTNQETLMLLQSGVRGKHWEYVDPSRNGGPIQYKEGYEKVTAREQDGARLFSLGAINTIDMRTNLLNPDLVKAIETYGSGDRWTDAVYFMALPSDGQYKQDLTLLMQTYFAEIITGQRSLDDFEQFVEEWKSRGGDALTKEANEVYQSVK